MAITLKPRNGGGSTNQKRPIQSGPVSTEQNFSSAPTSSSQNFTPAPNASTQPQNFTPAPPVSSQTSPAQNFTPAPRPSPSNPSPTPSRGGGGGGRSNPSQGPATTTPNASGPAQSFTPAPNASTSPNTSRNVVPKTTPEANYTPAPSSNRISSLRRTDGFINQNASYNKTNDLTNRNELLFQGGLLGPGKLGDLYSSSRPLVPRRSGSESDSRTSNNLNSRNGLVLLSARKDAVDDITTTQAYARYQVEQSRLKKLEDKYATKPTEKFSSFVTLGKQKPLEQRGKVGRLSQRVVSSHVGGFLGNPFEFAKGFSKQSLANQAKQYPQIAPSVRREEFRAFREIPRTVGKANDPRTEEGQANLIAIAAPLGFEGASAKIRAGRPSVVGVRSVGPSIGETVVSGDSLAGISTQRQVATVQIRGVSQEVPFRTTNILSGTRPSGGGTFDVNLETYGVIRVPKAAPRYLVSDPIIDSIRAKKPTTTDIPVYRNLRGEVGENFYAFYGKNRESYIGSSFPAREVATAPDGAVLLKQNTQFRTVKNVGGALLKTEEGVVQTGIKQYPTVLGTTQNVLGPKNTFSFQGQEVTAQGSYPVSIPSRTRSVFASQVAKGVPTRTADFSRAMESIYPNAEFSTSSAPKGGIIKSSAPENRPSLFSTKKGEVYTRQPLFSEERTFSTQVSTLSERPVLTRTSSLLKNIDLSGLPSALPESSVRVLPKLVLLPPSTRQISRSSPADSVPSALALQPKLQERERITPNIPITTPIVIPTQKRESTPTVRQSFNTPRPSDNRNSPFTPFPPEFPFYNEPRAGLALPGGGSFDFGRRGKGEDFSRRYQYTPSLTAAALNIRAKGKGKATGYTGGELRPVRSGNFVNPFAQKRRALRDLGKPSKRTPGFSTPTSNRPTFKAEKQKKNKKARASNFQTPTRSNFKRLFGRKK